MPGLLVNGVSKPVDCLIREPRTEIVQRSVTNILDEVRSHLETLEVDSTFFPEILNITRLNASVEQVGHRSIGSRVSRKRWFCPRQLVHRVRNTRGKGSASVIA
jgi:hypothetical protein